MDEVAVLAMQVALQRIEAKLDALIAALASDDEEEPQYSLDGDLIPGERAEGTSL